MAFVRLITEAFGCGDPRLEAVIAALDAQLAAPITHLQGVMSAKPLADRLATIESWLHPRAGAKIRAQVLSNGRKGDELVLFTVLNRTDRRVPPGVAVTEITVTLHARAIASDRLLPLIETMADASRAIWAQGFHGQDQHGLAAVSMEAKQRTGRLPELPTQTAAGHAVHSSLGWVGFVNLATASALDLPARSTRLGEAQPSREGAGWWYRLTPEPLDLREAAHRARVAAALEACT